MNAPLETIPDHLKEYITEQDPSLYTPIDQAVWRYVMRVSKAFFSKHGHPLYLQGLTTTGISTEHIPLISEMDQALRTLGWRAVAINGFIPPSVFLEFQSLRILAIACDIRKLENIGYTPSPDIIHEAAGHVPIVADPEYRKYLEAYGEVARNAIITRHDIELYEAVFNLSVIKEDPHSTPEQIAECQAKFEAVAKREVKASEASLLTRMAWWTTEYGLIEGDGRPLIYGAGLLSSISESFHCLSDEVKKIPFTAHASINTSYDITRPQPQLFVAKNFPDLIVALNEFADTMAFRKGGSQGLRVGVEAQNTVTAVLDSGVQLTGVLKDPFFMASGEEAGFVLSGLKQFSFHDHATPEIDDFHVGSEILIPLFPESVVSQDLESLKQTLEQEGLPSKTGLRLSGTLEKTLLLNEGTARILLLKNAKITDGSGRIVYAETGTYYPFVPASRLTSVFGGAADRRDYLLGSRKPTAKVHSHQSNLIPENQNLNALYQRVRDYRNANARDLNPLRSILSTLDQEHPLDWLLRLELLELFSKQAPSDSGTKALTETLMTLRDQIPERREMIDRGMELV